MPKIGRNDSCPCGSGKKYKRCCLDKDEAAERVAVAALQTEQRARMEDLYGSIEEVEQLTEDSNAVVDLVKSGQLDEAERAARELLERYPEVHDGYDRLGMVYEARGQHREAADCYRKVVEFVRAHPKDYDPAFETPFLELIAKLDPPAASS
jgi:tetratricopeptide (TPR) repeat protein